MLTKSHYAARHFINAKDRPIYRQHMCGLCHALGNEYGFATRLFTNHDAIFFSILINAQHPQEIPTIRQRCPINPRRKMVSNDDDAGKFAAATAITLAAVSVDDDVLDSKGHDVIAKTVRRLLKKPQHTALRVMENLDFDTSVLVQLSQNQSDAERADQDSEIPSAKAASALFAMTANLAGNTANEEALSAIGKQYGAYLYFADAYRDFSRDMAKGDYNPLRRFGIHQDGNIILSHTGLIWLLNRLQNIHSTLQTEITRLHLYRYEETVSHLLIMPVLALINKLQAQIARKETLAFRQWTFVDVLKSAFFVLPSPIADTGFTQLQMSYDDEYFEDDPSVEKPKRGEKSKRKRKRVDQKEESRRKSSICDGLYYVDCGDCDSDNDGNCDCFDSDCGGADCGDADCGGCDGADCGGADCG
jgi:hypothetical protein